MLKVGKLNGFSDFCIPYSQKHQELVEVLKELIELGYRNVAIEQTYVHETLSTKNGKDSLPEPVDLKEFNEKTNGKLNLFNRLTMTYSDPSIAHACNRSPNFKKFHIIAALPISEAAFQHSCQTLACDLITYNFDTVRMRFSRKFYYVAVRRNIFFEIKYTPTILDSNERRATITRAQQCHMVGKSKGIIISSGATDRFHVRSPYDVACLGYIFGLTEEQGRAGVSSMCKNLLIAAESRRLGRSPVVVRLEDIDSTTSEEEESDDDNMEVDDAKKRKISAPKNELNKKPKMS